MMKSRRTITKAMLSQGVPDSALTKSVIAPLMVPSNSRGSSPCKMIPVMGCAIETFTRALRLYKVMIALGTYSFHDAFLAGGCS